MNQTNVIEILSRASLGGLNAATAAINEQRAAVGRLMQEADATRAAAFGRALDSGVTRVLHAATAAAHAAAAAIRSIYSSAANLAGIGGLGVALFTGASIGAAMDFQQQLSIINTIAQQTPDVLRETGRSLLDLATAAGEPVRELTQGFYDLLSAGISTGDAMGVMGSAVDLAIGGLATTKQTVDLLTTALNAWGLEALGAANATDAARIAADIFAKSIELGKVTADQIAASIANVAPLAAQMGIALEEVGAGYAVLTARGVPAAEAATRMNSALVAMLRIPPGMAQLQEITGRTYATIASTEGIQTAMQQIVDDAQRAGVSLIDVFGRQEAMSFALQVTGRNAADWQRALAAMYESQGTAATQAAARADDAKRAIASLRASVFALMVEWGNAFLPGIARGARSVTTFVQAITAWTRQNQELIEQAAPIISLVSSIFALRTGAMGLMMVMGPLGALLPGFGGGLAGVLAIVTRFAFPLGLLVTGLTLFSRAVENNWNGLGRYRFAVAQLGNVFSDVREIGGRFVAMLGEVGGALVRGDVGGIFEIIGRYRGEFSALFAGLGSSVERFTRLVGEQLRGPFMRALTFVAAFLADQFGLSIGQVLVGMNNLWLRVVGLRDELFRLATAVLPLVGRALQFLIDVGLSVARALAPLALIIGVALLEALTRVVGVLADFAEWLGGASEGAATARDWIGRVTIALLGLWAARRVVDVLSDVVGWMRGIAATGRAAVSAILSIADAIRGIGARTISLGIQGGEAVLGAIGAVVDGLRALGSRAVSLSVTGVQAAADAIGSVISKLGELRAKSVRVGITGSVGAVNAIQSVIDKLAELKTKSIKVNVAMDTPTAIGNTILQALGTALGTVGGKLATSAAARGAMAGIGRTLVGLIAGAGIAGAVGAAIALAVGAGIIVGVQNPDLAGASAGLQVGGVVDLINQALSGALDALDTAALIGGAIAFGLASFDTWLRERLGEVDLNVDVILDPIRRWFDELEIDIGELWASLWTFDVQAILDAAGQLALDLQAAPLVLQVAIGDWLEAQFGGAIEGFLTAADWWATQRQKVSDEIWRQFDIALQLIPQLELKLPFNLALPEIDVGAWWDTATEGFQQQLDALPERRVDIRNLDLQVPDLGAPFRDFLNYLSTVWGPSIDAVPGWWSELWAGVGSTIASVWDGILASVGANVAGILSNLATLASAIAVIPSPWQSSWATIAETLRGAAGDVATWSADTSGVVDATGRSVGGTFDAIAKQPGRLADAMRDSVTRAATEAANLGAAADVTPHLPDMYWNGYRVGNTLASGLSASYDLVYSAAAGLGRAITRGGPVILSEPKDPANPLRGITRWGYNIVKTITDSMLHALPMAQSAGYQLSSVLAPNLAWSWAAAGSTEALPIGPRGGGVYDSARNGNGQEVGLLAQLVTETQLQNQQLARMAARDPDAAGPLAARSQLEVLRSMQGRG